MNSNIETVVYIAGPFRAKNAWEVENNIRDAENVAYKLASLGYSFICPHTNGRFFDGTITDLYWLESTKRLLLRCDCVIFLDGWRQSVGSIGEHQLARDVGIPIYYNIEDLHKVEGSRRQ